MSDTSHPAVRVTPETYRMLRELSSETSESMTTVIARAIAAFEQQRFWEIAKAQWAGVLANPELAQMIAQEDAELEGTLNDGLEDEEPW